MSIQSPELRDDGTKGTCEIRSTWDGQPVDKADWVELHIERTQTELIIDVRAPFYADPAPPSPPGSTWGLWEYEVVELFVLGADERYTEIELSPHGHFLVLTLHGERQFDKRELPLHFQATVTGDQWVGRAILDAEWLPPDPRALNAFAIHGIGSERTYLALSPPGGPQPDFHQLHAFLPAPWLTLKAGDESTTLFPSPPKDT